MNDLYDGVVGVGEYDDYDVDGDDMMGDDMMGAAGGFRAPLRSAARHAPRLLRLPPRPGWRAQVAPGVSPPGVGLWPLPLRPETNNGVFTDVISSMTFTATPQVPFRGERLLATVARSSGAGGVLALASAIIVGTTPQTADIGDLSLDMFVPGAFGVRLRMQQATPGMLIRAIVQAQGIPVGETVGISLAILGQVVRA